MKKIANTQELTAELNRLLDYAGSHQPSREVLASELQKLSFRMGGTMNKTALYGFHSHYKTAAERALAIAAHTRKPVYVYLWNKNYWLDTKPVHGSVKVEADFPLESLYGDLKFLMPLRNDPNPVDDSYHE